MPHTQALRRSGLTGRTRYSTPYLLTPQMWATILTGRSPGSHGIFDYWQRRPDGSFFETRGRDVRGPRIWDELSKNGIPCGFINVPMTYPPPQVPGFALSGQDAPRAHRSIAFPRELYGEIVRRFGRYHHKDIFPGGRDKLSYGQILLDEVDRQARLFEWLVQRDDWRFLMLYTSGTAFAQHYFWDDMDRGEGHSADFIWKTFQATDELIGRVVKSLMPSDSIFVMSECGAGPIGGGVRLNSLLQQEGFLAHQTRKGAPSLRARALAKMRVAAQRYLPKSSFHFANSLPFKGWVQGTIVDDGIDWRRTIAYHRGKGEGNIYLNVIGRDPRGSLPKSNYEHVRTEIIRRLTSLVDPRTGAPAVAAVHRREEIFAGEYLGSAPDLIVEWDGFRYMPSEDVAATSGVFGSRTREYMSWPTSGSHRPEGLLLASGGPVRRGVLERPIELINLAPTWLALLNCPVSHTIEGKAVNEILKSDQSIMPNEDIESDRLGYPPREAAR